MDEEAEQQLRQGRILLWVSIAGTILFVATMKANSMALAIIGMAASFLGAVGGIRNVARATEGNSLVMLLSMAVGFAPGFNVLPVIYYLGRAQSALKAADMPAPVRAPAPARKPAPTAAPKAAAPSKTAPPKTAASATAQGLRRNALGGAIASVKQAGLQVAEGALLGAQVRMPDGTPMPHDSMPVLRGTQGFAVCYLVDRGSHYTWATMGELQASGMTLDELHLVGVANLMVQANSGKPGLKLLPQENFFGLVMGGQFEASLVLVDELWDDKLREQTPNGPVVAIPARDICAFCDAGNEAGIAALRKVVERVYKDPANLQSHLVSDKLFIRTDGKWREYTGPKRADLAPLEFKL